MPVDHSNVVKYAIKYDMVCVLRWNHRTIYYELEDEVL